MAEAKKGSCRYGLKTQIQIHMSALDVETNHTLDTLMSIW